MVGCMVKDVKTAPELGPLLFVPQILFAGFFIKTEQVPVFLRWAQYLCSLKYGMNLYLINEFGEETRKSWPLGAQTVAATFIESNDINPDTPYLYWAILVGIIIAVRGLSIY